MMLALISYVILSVVALVYATPIEKCALSKGIDVAGYQCNIDMVAQKRAGIAFAYVKATEGTTFRNPRFSKQYTGAYNAGIIHGAYHFARPDHSSGTAQAEFFLKHGGNWSADGKTLPGMLDMEYGPKGKTCWGLSASRMVAWVKEFSDYYHSKTGRYPTIYTGTNWWKTCTGNSAAFGKTNPLDVAHYASSVGPLPAGWTHWTFWQYTSKPFDHDYFNGDQAALVRFAKGS
ncbi:hypothetical protein FRC09_000644 [Ceratobasidium sp. 395]|nr:hypothetical protein FRC09_000644 [Ceratobasidium sp. 395]